MRTTDGAPQAAQHQTASQQSVPMSSVPQVPTQQVHMPAPMPDQNAPAPAPVAPQPIMGMPPLPQQPASAPATQAHATGPAVPAPSIPTATQQSSTPGSSAPTMPQPQPRFVQAPQPPSAQAPQQQVQGAAEPIDMENLARSGGVGLGIGVGAAFVTSLITAILALAVSSSVLDQVFDAAGSLGASTSTDLLDNVHGMNILQSIIFFMIQGIAGGFSINYQGDGLFSSVSASGSAWMGAGLSGYALALGVAFGVYMFGRENTIRFRWMGVATSAVVGVAAGIVYELLALVGRIQVSSVTISGTSVRTFLMAFLFAGGGALAGYALAQTTPDASNVFSAIHLWFHRARGFIRTFAETLFVFAVLALAVALILYVYASIRAGEAALILLFPALLPLISGFLFSVGSLGAMAVYGGNSGMSLGLLTSSAATSSVSGFGWFWLYVLLVVIATLYLGLREAARNMYDPAYAGWQYSWKAPLAAAVFWLVFSYATLSVGGSAEGHTAFIMPAMWSFLIAAFWSFLVEVVALTFGPSIIVSVPGLWKLIVGGTVRPTPKEVLDYSSAMNRRSSGATAPAATVSGGVSPSVPSPVTPAMPGSGAQNNGDPRTVQMAAPAAAPATPPVSGVPGTPAAVQPMSPNAKKTMIIVGIIVGVLVVAAATIGILTSTVFNPKNTVNEYLGQLSSGDYDAASKTVDPGIDTNRRALLTSAASDNGKNALSSPKVDSVTVNGSDATAQIEYSVHGTVTKGTLTLRKDGSTMLFFPKWVVSKPLLTNIVVENSGAVDSVLVNNVKVSKKNAGAGSSDGYLVFAVYPGTYTVSLPKNDYLTASSVTKYVTGGSSSSMVEASIKVKATDKLVSAINDAMKAKLGKCGKVSDANSDTCPLNERIYSTDSKRNLSWTITKFPAITRKDISITSSGISFRTDYGDGKATLTYEQQDWFDENTWTPETEDFSFSLSGTVNIANGKPDVTFED